MKAYYEFTQHIEQDICKTYSFHRYLAIVLTHFTFGLGHLVSPYARKIWFYVAKKYYYYILSVFGVWNNAIYKSFRFSKPLDEASAKITDKGAKNCLKFSDEMSATISTRALCLMFIPQFAVVSMYTVATAGSTYYHPSRT